MCQGQEKGHGQGMGGHKGSCGGHPQMMGFNMPNMMRMLKHNMSQCLGHGGHTVPYNMNSVDDGYLVVIPLSGRTKEDVKVSLYNNILNVKASKPKGDEGEKVKAEGGDNGCGCGPGFFRNFFNFIEVDLDIPLPPDANEDEIKSVMANGLLKIKVGKKPAKTINVDDERN